MYRYISLLTASLSIVYSLPIAMNKRKTKQQKIIADLRRKVQVNQPIHASESSSKSNDIQKHTATFTFTAPQKTSFYQAGVAPKTSRMLTADLQKTGIVTSAIIIAEVILFFLLKQHMFAIPMVNY